MNAFLIIFLSITSFFAIYWIIAGQWKYNKMMREGSYKMEDELKKLEEESKNKKID